MSCQQGEVIHVGLPLVITRGGLTKCVNTCGKHWYKLITDVAVQDNKRLNYNDSYTVERG